MRSLLAGLSAVFVLALAPVASAQDGPPSPEAVAANKANADKILADGGAAAFFSNETDHDNRMDVRHSASGVFCQFQREGVNALTLAEPSGDSFACHTEQSGAIKVAWTLTVRRTALPFKDERKAAEQALKARYSKARTIVEPGIGRQILKPGERRWAEAGYNRYYTTGDDIVRRRSLIVVEGWLLVLDTEAPRENFAAMELVSNVVWMDALLGAADKAIKDDAAAKAGQTKP